MSVSPDATSTYTCSHCGDDRTLDETVRGSYCSEVCYFESVGKSAIARIRSDHRWCATCFRRIKTVNPPREDDPDFIIGYQFPTEHTHTESIDEWTADTVDDEQLAETAPDSRPLRAYDTVASTRWACTCGAVDPGDEHDLLRDTDPRETIVSLWECLTHLSETDAIDADPDREAFMAALREEWCNWHYAIGRSLEAD